MNESAQKQQILSIPYKPQKPEAYNPPIGLIGAGGITSAHLSAYKRLGLNVVAIADINEENAQKQRKEFFPKATVYTDHKAMLARDDIEVVDVATHVNVRPKLVEDALRSGRHVLSQKPFVTDIAQGREVIALAERLGLTLAVNQNGRWAPHFSYLRNAIEHGLIGKVNGINCVCHWDHTWVKDNKAFESMLHVILYDFSIHWFDIVSCFMGGQRPKSVFASMNTFEGQCFNPPSMASVIIDYPDTHVNMHFHGHVSLGQQDNTTILGTQGTLRSCGPSLNEQPQVEVFLEDGMTAVHMEGGWATSGFEGTMCELLCAIEQKRQPSNSAASTLLPLELCFAAMKSAETGQVQSLRQ